MERNTISLCLVILAAMSTVYMQGCKLEMFNGIHFCVYDKSHKNHDDAIFGCFNNFARLPSWDDIRKENIHEFFIRKLTKSTNRTAWLSDPGVSSHKCAAVEFIFIGNTGLVVHAWFRNYPCSPPHIKPYTICLCYDECKVPISKPGEAVTEPLYPDNQPVSEPTLTTDYFYPTIEMPGFIPITRALPEWEEFTVSEPNLMTDTFYPTPGDMPDFIPITRVPLADLDKFHGYTTTISELTTTSDRRMSPITVSQMEGEKGPYKGAIAGGVTVAILVVIAMIVVILKIYKRWSKKDDNQYSANISLISTSEGIDKAVYFIKHI